MKPIRSDAPLRHALALASLCRSPGTPDTRRSTPTAWLQLILSTIIERKWGVEGKWGLGYPPTIIESVFFTRGLPKGKWSSQTLRSAFREAIVKVTLIGLPKQVLLCVGIFVPKSAC